MNTMMSCKSHLFLDSSILPCVLHYIFYPNHLVVHIFLCLVIHKNVLLFVIRVVSDYLKSPFLLSLALFQLGFAGIRPSALKDLTVVAEELGGIIPLFCFAMVNFFAVKKK